MLKRAALSCAGMAFAATACTQSSVPEANPEQVVAAVRDCALATSVGAVDISSLLDAGWASATAITDGGENVDLGMTILGKEDGGSIIMIGSADGDNAGVCAVTGQLDDAHDFDSLITELDANFTADSIDNGDHFFHAGNDMVVAARSGSVGGKSYRIAVLELEYN